MKKRVRLIAAFAILIVFSGVLVMKQDKQVCLRIKEDQFYISMSVDDRTENIYPWYNEKEDLYYVFLPSCVKKDIIYIDKALNNDIEVNGMPIRVRFDWTQGEIYNIKMNHMLYRFTFMKSANIPAFFMEADSGSMDYIHEDKDNEENGYLTIISNDGTSQYSGKLTKISGRGNSTWLPQAKKPYSIALTDKCPLCGLSAGKEWKLLSLYFEHDKIHSKIIFDLGREMGIENTPECTWVDLYCQGEYKGLYLLTEDISEKADNDYKYLIEKTINEQLHLDESSFSTEWSGILFKFAKPHYPTDRQLEETVNTVQTLDDFFKEKDLQYVNYIDMDSFAKQFLIDKIVMEKDAMLMSTFFYVEGEKLSAGPLWDYDRAAGEILSDYTEPMEGDPNGMYAWYMALYENEEFYNTMVQYYVDYLPYFRKMLEEDIDDYVENIDASVKMDSVLMRNLTKPNETVSYQSYDNYVRYLKYFLANRLNYLGELWNVEEANFEAPKSTGEIHKVDLSLEDGTILETMYIRDGECVENMPVLDEEKYWGWYYHVGEEHRGKVYNYLLPVYEDTVIYALEKA